MMGDTREEKRRKAKLEQTREADEKHEHFVRFVMQKLGIREWSKYCINLNKLTNREIASLVSEYNAWKETA
jgi:hypothetical protein